MYSIHLMPEGEIYGIGGLILQSPVIPRVDEILNVHSGDIDQKVFVHQVAYRYESPEETANVPLVKISALVAASLWDRGS